MRFTVDGEELDDTPAVVAAIIKLFASYPDTKLLTTKGLAARLGCSLSHLHDYTTDPRIREYRTPQHNRHNRYLWGTAATIEAYKKEKNHEPR